MPKGQNKKTTSRYSLLDTILLLVKITLVKIGNTPFLAFHYLLPATRWIIDICTSVVRHLPGIRMPNFQNILYYIFCIFSFGLRKRTVGRPKKLRFSRRSKIVVALSSFSIFLFIYTVFILTAAYELPTPTRLINSSKSLTSEFYDRNGKLLYRLYEGQNRTLVKLEQIPKHLIQATIAIEDQNFYQHPGIDPVAIVRAFYHNLKTDNLEGASTITQQLIKNSLLTPEKSYIRKTKEIILAIWAERIYSKNQILQMYFNEAPYGGAIVGVAAASETYFGKTPSELNLAESAYLAGLPASPTEFSPYGTKPELTKLRQKDILQKMVKNNYITQTEADRAFSENLKIKPLTNNINAPHFIFYIKDLLAKKYGSRIVAEGGLKIYTTLDLDLQKQVEAIVAKEIENLKNLNVKNGAAMVVDATTGQILSMVGSRNYDYPSFGNFNVTLALRQPGSAIKPITYATAFKLGFNPNNIILDTPVVFKNQWGSSYAPVNYDNTFKGPVTLRQALGSSLNIPAVKLLATIGLDPVIQTAQNLGITTFDDPKRYGLSLTLGGAEIKMIEMIGVYGAFARNGLLHQPTGIIKVTDSGNNVLEEYKNSPKQAISPQIAYLITSILSDDNARKLAFGSRSLLNIPGYEVGAKTGTSDNKRDNWTFGYTPKFVVGVWVGNPDNSPMHPVLTSGITGASPIWNKIIHLLIDDTPPLAFEKPPLLAESVIDGKKDISQTGVIPKSMVRIRKSEDKLIFSDSFSTWATPSGQTVSLQHHPAP
ncbi:PBP1A family penicillin-binding protein [Patescibacteria group bacterium]|nr:PBP1A family penicillin-binding protein [Patescibacteria group bacterium]